MCVHTQILRVELRILGHPWGLIKGRVHSLQSFTWRRQYCGCRNAQKVRAAYMYATQHIQVMAYDKRTSVPAIPMDVADGAKHTPGSDARACDGDQAHHSYEDELRVHVEPWHLTVDHSL